jgi:hypothetical protein
VAGMPEIAEERVSLGKGPRVPHCWQRTCLAPEGWSAPRIVSTKGCVGWPESASGRSCFGPRGCPQRAAADVPRRPL